jgi:hypothetical protein
VLDPFPVAALLRAATRDDASIPRPSQGETRIASVWTVTVQASVFLAIAVLPLIVIHGWPAVPSSAAAMAGLVVATRQSQCRYLRLRLN